MESFQRFDGKKPAKILTTDSHGWTQIRAKAFVHFRGKNSFFSNPIRVHLRLSAVKNPVLFRVSLR